MRSAPFWDITQRVVVISYRRFGTPYRSRTWKWDRWLDSWPLNMTPIGCPEMSARNYHHWLRNKPEVRSSQILPPSHFESFKIFSARSLLWRQTSSGMPSALYKHETDYYSKLFFKCYAMVCHTDTYSYGMHQVVLHYLRPTISSRYYVH